MANTARALSRAVQLLAFTGLVRRLRSGRRDVTAVALALSPIPLLGAVAYGGEMLLRVYLFSLPWLAFLAAAALLPTGSRRLSWRSVVATATASCLLAGALLTAYYGQEKSNHIRRSEVEAATYFYANAPAGSLMMLLTPNFPSRVAGNYADYDTASLLGDPKFRKVRPLSPADLPTTVRLLQDRAVDSVRSHRAGEAAADIVLSRSQKAYAEVFGLAATPALDAFEQTLLDSGRFDLVYDNGDAQILRLRTPITSSGPAGPSPAGSPVAAAGGGS